jgi:hypothetical protein
VHIRVDAQNRIGGEILRRSAPGDRGDGQEDEAKKLLPTDAHESLPQPQRRCRLDRTFAPDAMEGSERP